MMAEISTYKAQGRAMAGWGSYCHSIFSLYLQDKVVQASYEAAIVASTFAAGTKTAYEIKECAVIMRYQKVNASKQVEGELNANESYRFPIACKRVSD
jgi:hypothetical protein